MRKGFTILELLVASLLLGMLMTILTMIFNQSSIAWRTGVAGVSDMDDVRETVASVRYQADSAYPDLNGEVKCVLSVFDENGDVRSDRGVDSFKEGSLAISSTVSTDVKDSYKSNVACGSDNFENPNGNYVINVKSAGPDGVLNTYDDIWSFPDDPNEWCK